MKGRFIINKSTIDMKLPGVAKNRGQPAKTPSDRLQAKMWFSSVSLKSGMNAGQLERLFLSQIDPVEGSTKDSPHAWLKYESGDRLPRDKKEDKRSVVSLAEQEFPGTAHWFRSPLWWVLNNPEWNPQRLTRLIVTTHPAISQLFNKSRPGGQLDILFKDWECLCRMASFEAFGAMVAYSRLRGQYDRSIADMCACDCRWWLHTAQLHFEEIQTHLEELVTVLQANAPELGDLAFLGKELPLPFMISG